MMRRQFFYLSFLAIACTLTSSALAQCNDVVTNGAVDEGDLLLVADSVGPCSGSSCLGDINGNGFVGENDYQALLGTLGPCPGSVFDVNNDGNLSLLDMVAVVNNTGVDCALDIDDSGAIDIHDLYIVSASQDALASADAEPAADVDGDSDVDSDDRDSVRLLVNDGDNCRADVDDDNDVDSDDFDAVCAAVGFC